MIIYLICVFFIAYGSSFSFHEKCKLGKIDSCYDSNIFGEVIPVNNSGNPFCGRFLVWTDPIDESIQVTLTVSVVVLKIEGATPSQTEECRKNQINKYNLTLRVKDSEFEFIGNNTFDYNVKPSNIISGITSVESEYDESTYMKQILDDLGGKYILEVSVPVGRRIIFMDIEYVHPDGQYDCSLKFMMYSCWIKYLLFKIIGAVLGGIFLLSSIVCCPLVVLVCALLYCKNKAKKMNS